MSNKRFPVFILSIALFLLISLPCSAEYLFDTAQKFRLGGHELLNISTADINGDGIRDLVGLCQSYTEPGSNDAVVVLPGTGNGLFGDPIDTLVDNAHWNIHLALIDGDADLDLVLRRYYSDHAFTVLLGNGDGTFTEVGQTITETYWDMEIGDFTGDGVTDLVMPQGLTVQLHVGQGDGTFVPGPASAVSDSVQGLTSGDFDEDGDLDLVTAHYDYPNEDYTVLFNDGSGAFTQGPASNLSIRAEVMATVDLNGDGNLDFLAGEESSSGWLRYLRGNGDGTFLPVVTIDVGQHPDFWDVGDLDGDGDLDIVANSDYYNTRQVAVTLNNGDGTFGEPAFSFGRAEQICLDDMDGDGHLDAVMLCPPGERHAVVLLGRGDGTFRCHRTVGADIYYPYRMVTDDLDGDGDTDFIIGYDNEPSPPLVHAIYNEYPNGYSDPAGFNPNIYPDDLATGDLDGDGWNDLFVIDLELNRMATMMNDGSGAFVSPANMTVGNEPVAAALGDLDGDGDLDAAVIHRSFSNLGILLNDGDGTFGTPAFYDATNKSWAIALGDLDGDGDLDVAVDEQDGNDGAILVLKNNGDGSFAAPVRYECTSPVGVAIADFDGDGDLDLATTGYQIGYCSVLLNSGTGAFSPPVTYFTDQEIGWRIRSADIDLDGDQDLLSLGVGSFDVAVLYNAGDATFEMRQNFTTGNGGGTMALADLDNDDDQDLALLSVYDLLIVPNNTVFIDSTGLLVTGPGPGQTNPTLVRYFPGTSGRGYTEWSAYGVDRWGVNVALGELDGTPGPEVLTGAGPGPIFGPHVRGFQNDGTPLPGVSFLTYGTNKWGVNVCSGDLDDDGYDEIVTGAGPGAVFGPHVRAWNWDGAGAPQPIPGISYFAYGTPKWGVNVSCGDIDGDGYDEIVTGAGPGAVYGPHVRGWNCDGGGAVAIPQVSFLAYGTNKFGVNVACGDIDGDGIDEMVTGAGPGAVFGPHVRAWNWDGSGTTQSIPAVSYFAYNYTQWGVNVSCGDLDGDGIDEIITGAGPGESHEPRVRGWNYDGQALSAISGIDFNAYGSTEVTHGVKVGGLRD